MLYFFCCPSLLVSDVTIGDNLKNSCPFRVDRGAQRSNNSALVVIHCCAVTRYFRDGNSTYLDSETSPHSSISPSLLCYMPEWVMVSLQINS